MKIEKTTIKNQNIKLNCREDDSFELILSSMDKSGSTYREWEIIFDEHDFELDPLLVFKLKKLISKIEKALSKEILAYLESVQSCLELDDRVFDYAVHNHSLTIATQNLCEAYEISLAAHAHLELMLVATTPAALSADGGEKVFISNEGWLQSNKISSKALNALPDWLKKAPEDFYIALIPYPVLLSDFIA